MSNETLTLTITLPRELPVTAGKVETTESLVNLSAETVADLVLAGLTRKHQEAASGCKDESAVRKARENMRNALNTGTWTFDRDVPEAMVRLVDMLKVAGKLPDVIVKMTDKKRAVQGMVWIHQNLPADKVTAQLAKINAQIEEEKRAAAALAHDVGGLFD